MIDNTKIIRITNRDNGISGYKIPDLGNLYRSFQPGESKDITMDELRKLAWTPGGKAILKDCFIINDEEALRELLSDVEPEYFYTESDIKTLLEKGTLDQFMDCLDFAPDGVIELVKELAVKTELNDIAKRTAILNRTGFNVTKAIEVNKETAETDDNADENKGMRRAAPINSLNNDEDAAPKRRAAAPSQYKVVAKK